jgi:hypothetical protein
MNHTRNSLAGDLALADTNYQRRDLRCRDIVDHAIAVQESRNTMSAVEFLKSHDIAAHVIERVLLEPERRRTISEP